ncbi:MAG: hypothetical protein MHM6MM_008205, partial [Cercozoa sp. M6MM]
MQLRALTRAQARLAAAFVRYGLWASKHRWRVIVFALGVVAVFASGIAFLEVEDDTATLFTPAGSRAHVDYDNIAKWFPNDLTEHNILDIFIARKDGNTDNALEHPDVLQVLKEVETVIEEWCTKYVCDDVSLGGVVPNSTDWPADLSERVRINDTGVCAPVFFDPKRDMPTLARQVVDGPFVATPNCPAQQHVKVASAVRRVAFMARVRSEETEATSDLESALDRLLQWSNTAQERLGPQWLLAVSNDAALDVELANSVSGDVLFFAVTFVLLVGFAVAAFWRVRRSTVAWLDVLGGTLAVAMAMGLCSYAGVKFTSVASFFPFLLMGMSVDDTFVALRAFQRAPCGRVSDVESHAAARVAHMLRAAGPSMLMTSLTSAAAFLVGAVQSAFLAVRSFCVFCCVG